MKRQIVVIFSFFLALPSIGIATERMVITANRFDIPFILPLKTKLMQPGRISSRSQRLGHLMQPVFLIGSDHYSHTWLQANHQQFVKLNAIGLLIEAKNLTEIKRVIALAKGLRIIPASADDIAKQHGLTHYPVLLMSDGWVQ